MKGASEGVARSAENRSNLLPKVRHRLNEILQTRMLLEFPPSISRNLDRTIPQAAVSVWRGLVNERYGSDQLVNDLAASVIETILGFPYCGVEFFHSFIFEAWDVVLVGYIVHLSIQMQWVDVGRGLHV